MCRSIFICLGFLMGISPIMAMTIVTVEQKEHRHVLQTTASKISFPLSTENKDLIDSMKKKLHELGGVGLAAPQVNAAKQIAVIYIPEEAKLLREHVEIYPMHVLINPSYEPLEKTAMHSDFESCYSVSSKAGKVPRYDRIKLSYYDEDGTLHQQIEHGFYARVLQHEIDHLNGVLIVDRLTPDCVQGTVKEIMALRRAELPVEKQVVFDQIVARKFKK